MKRKIFSVLLVLALVAGFGLVTALPAAAATTRNVIPYTLGSLTDATPTWSTAQQNSGSSSALLVHSSGANQRAYVQFAPPAGITLTEFVAAPATYGFSYWRTEDKIGPQLELTFTDDADGWVELTAEVALYDYTTDDLTVQWIDKTLSGTEQCQFFGDDSANASYTGTGLGNLSALIVDIAARATADNEAAVGAWEMTKVIVDLGWSGDTQTAYVDDVIIDGTTYDLEGTAADYETIQAAIDASAATGDTVTVAAGVYRENVTVDEELTLTGASSATVTVISSYAQPAFLVTAANVEISGFTMTGTGIDPSVNLPLAGVYIDSVDGCTISDNVMVGESHGVYLDAGSNSNTITGNNASDNNQGFTMEPYDGSGASSNNIFTDNIANECWKYGFFVEGGEGCTFTGNTANLNTKNGFRFVSGEDNTLNYNNIVGNTLEGVNQCGTPPTVDLDATNNWWGKTSGPADAVALAATGYTAYGDSVTADVDYEPWLLAAAVSGTGTTYDKTLALKDDWTLVSVDKEVTTGTWVGETILSGTDTILAYKYTPGTGFPQVELATQLTSVDAYYIKTDGGGGVGINYSTSSPGVVTKTLSAGWNIISCAAETNAPTLLSQLRYAQIGEQEGAGVTNLIGQATYGQYTLTSLSEPLATSADWTAMGSPVTLNAFDGYWVYMNAAKSFGVIPD